jgi:hypothetical protein
MRGPTLRGPTRDDRERGEIIPAAFDIDLCAGALGDLVDLPRQVGEGVPGGVAGVEDVVVGLEHPFAR